MNKITVTFTFSEDELAQLEADVRDMRAFTPDPIPNLPPDLAFLNQAAPEQEWTIEDSIRSLFWLAFHERHPIATE